MKEDLGALVKRSEVNLENENISGFDGFYEETVYFFKELKEHNNRQWFDQNRDLYEEYVMNPARSFIVEMGARLKEISPDIIGDPRINKSIFRINRDVRFSKDKSPYKTHMGIVFWDGIMPRMESSVFYFHLESSNVLLGAGMYRFTKTQLEEYRNSVVHKRFGKQLSDIYTKVSGKGFEFGGKNYKKIPRGFDPEHKNAEFLLYDGMHVGKSFDIPEEFFSKDFIDYCFKPYKEMLPIQQWLSDLSRRVK